MEMKIMKKTVVVPSYFTDVKKSKDRIIYDHPTDVNGPETLSRLLESFTILKDKNFDIVIIGVPDDPVISSIVEKRVETIIKPFKADYKIIHLSVSLLKKLQERFEQLGFSDMAKQVNLRGYANVRNICILIPHLLGSDVAILIDDDEIFTDVDFIRKATEFIGEKWQGQEVWGKVGYYVYGGPKDYNLPEEKEWWKVFWGKAKKMNEAFKILDSGQRLVPAKWGFGGNMVIHRKIFENVAFDPHITRGEDIDYMLNARTCGFQFFLDTELYIKHQPPKSTPKTFLDVMNVDIFRFTYQREKLKNFNISADTLLPYPGIFLQEDLEARILLTALLLEIDKDLNRLDRIKSIQDLINYAKNLKTSLPSALEYAKKHAHTYGSFQKNWVKFMQGIKEDTMLKKMIEEGS